MLSLMGVCVSFGKRPVLTGVNLSMGSGESVAIIGRSGSGKSTLLSVAMGLVVPNSGSVAINDVDLQSLSRPKLAKFRAATTGVVFQGAELLPELSAIENVLVPSLLSRGRPAEESAREALRRLEVPEMTLASDLSGGERMRVAIARALVMDPILIVADEPTGSLDPDLRDESASLLFDRVSERGCALLLVTHDDAVAKRADQVYRLSDGVLSRF